MAQQTEAEVYYPESDGQPMGETDIHRDLVLELVSTLARWFAGRPDVYVTGNLFFYYVKGQPSQVVCPDVCVVFGVVKRRRSTYQTWRDGPFPQLVIELTSSSTRKQDVGVKPGLYERLGVLEYYLFDPHFDPEGPEEPEGPGDLSRYVRPSADVPFGPAQVVAAGAMVHSDLLGLGLTVRGQDLRLVDEATGRLVPTGEELAEAADQAQAAAEQAAAEARARAAAEERARVATEQAATEARARAEAEAESRALAEELARLRAQLDRRPDGSGA
jgi:Uma2 family endonuclease